MFQFDVKVPIIIESQFSGSSARATMMRLVPKRDHNDRLIPLIVKQLRFPHYYKFSILMENDMGFAFDDAEERQDELNEYLEADHGV